MTPERMREKLAEWAGWSQKLPLGLKFAAGWLDPNGNYQAGKAPFPNYVEDLNAVRELEMKLDHLAARKYVRILTGTRWAPWDEIDDAACYEAVVSPATQRCEALLKTLGLWEDA